MLPKLWTLLRRGGERFAVIDGAQWAGALAYSAFASLFPMILLFLTAASFVIDPDRAGRSVIRLVDSYLPMNAGMRGLISATIIDMAASRGRAGAAALLMLVWTAGQCFATFLSAANRAWGVETADWWRLPLRSLILLAVLAGAAPAGLAASAAAQFAMRHLPGRNAHLISGFASIVVPLSLEFIGLTLFYRFAPRRPTRVSEVWGAALIATLLLRAAENLFVVYLDRFTASNAVYGVFGGIMALLLWIYLTGCIFIFGACLCAARLEP